MASRMQCLECGAVDWAETVLPGSDRAEALGWLLFGLPGWLYCAWRHGLRAKACAACGGRALARETRAAAAADPVLPPAAAAGIPRRRGALVWPGALRTPRERLVRGGVWTLGWAIAAAGWPGPGLAVASLGLLTLRAPRDVSIRCRAWDAAGRELSIEWA